MEGSLTEQYLQCYRQLQQPALSKTANRSLLHLEASVDAWNIAYDLLKSPDPELSLHGAQLLSKKLNSPPPESVNLQVYLQFLLSIHKKTPVLWLCIAKILLHLSPKEPYLPSNIPHEQSLQLIRQIPAALSHIRTEIPFDAASMKDRFLTKSMPIFKSSMQKQPALVLQCLDAFVSYGTKIRDPEIVRFLLILPFEDASHVLQQVISRQSFPNMNDEIISYLSAHRNDQQALALHLAFFQLVDFSAITFEQFRSGIEYIFTCLSQDDNQCCSRLAESYELWHRIADQLQGGLLEGNKTEIARDAFLTLWNLVGKRSVLSVMPQRNVLPESPLSIDVDVDVDDDEEDIVTPTVPQPNRPAQFFRTYAGDFYVLIIQSLQPFPEAQSALFQSLNTLCTSELLHLQLAIHIIMNLTPKKSSLMGAVPSIRSIFSRATQMNEYLCSKVIELIGELSSLVSQVADLVLPMLLFLSSSLMFPALAVIASLSCCNLLEEIEEGQQQLSENMQQFLGHAYEVLFKDDCQIKVIENLTRAMVIFIYKFKRNPEDYRAYLQIFYQRCKQLNREKQCNLIEAAISGQLWINSREQISPKQETKRAQNPYMVVFGGYLEKQVELFLAILESADKKKVFSQTIKLINIGLRTYAVGTGEIWANLCDYLLSRYLSLTPPLPIVITPLINLTKCACDIESPNLRMSVSFALKKWHRPITDLLDYSYNHCDFTLSGTVLNLHLKIVQFLKNNPTLKNQINYQPELVVGYIIGIMKKQELWEYEVFKNGLNYFLIALQLGYPPRDILHCVLSAFGKLQETLWSALDPILMLVYRNYGFHIYIEVLGTLGSSLANQNNPLHSLLQQAFERGEGKTVKNLFLSL